MELYLKAGKTNQSPPRDDDYNRNSYSGKRHRQILLLIGLCGIVFLNISFSTLIKTISPKEVVSFYELNFGKTDTPSYDLSSNLEKYACIAAETVGFF